MCYTDWWIIRRRVFTSIYWNCCAWWRRRRGVRQVRGFFHLSLLTVYYSRLIMAKRVGETLTSVGISLALSLALHCFLLFWQMHVVYDEIECVAFWEKGLNMGLIKFVLIGFRLRKWIKCENAIIWVCRINLMCLSPKCRWEYRLMIYLFKTEMKYGQWAVVDKSLVDYPPPNFLLNIWVNDPNVGFPFYSRPSCFRTWKHSLNLTWCWRLTGFKPHDVENVGESIYSLRCHMGCGFTGWKSSCMQIQIVKCIVVKSSVCKWTLRVQLNLSLDMVFGVTILFLFEEVFFCVYVFWNPLLCGNVFVELSKMYDNTTRQANCTTATINQIELNCLGLSEFENSGKFEFAGQIK